MRITQGYVSKSIIDFPFHEIYNLDDYKSNTDPAVFFGMYRYEDYALLSQHNSDAIIFWTGQDCIQEIWKSKTGVFKYRNVAGKRIHERIKAYGYDCHLIQPPSFINTVNPQQLGTKIYAYCPSNAPYYHGKKLIDQLRCGGYEIIIGDGRHTQEEWKHVRNGYYNDAFIGLCLSEFAGGGSSVIEMGLRGINVVTNVFDLPNCKPFKSVDDIAYIIEEEKKRIGTVNEQLANDVWNDLDHDFNWLNI